MPHPTSRRARRLTNSAGVALLAALFATGCVPGRTYRSELSDPACVPTDANVCEAHVLHSVDESSSALIGFVEFDDQGYLREPELKDALMRRIDAIGDTRPLLLVVFAHGWKHNASADDGNVQEYRRLLTKLAAADAQVCAGTSCKNRQVIGVYLGWRGLSTRVEPLKTLSFWGRKSRAHRVGLDGAVEVLQQLAKLKSRKRPDNIDNGNRLVLTGHSFGAALLYTAVRQQLVHDLYFLNNDRIARNAADLIVLVNPAFEAARFQAIHRNASHFDFQPGQRPILAIFTSETDTATKYAFPAGRSLSTLFSEHRDATQRKENITAIGHYAPYRTHELTLAGPGSAAQSFRADACAWEEFRFGRTDTWTVAGVELRREITDPQSPRRFDPYVVARVQDGVISGHNAIWGEVFSNFLYRFVAVQSRRHCPAPD